MKIFSVSCLKKIPPKNFFMFKYTLEGAEAARGTEKEAAREEGRRGQKEESSRGRKIR